MSLRTMSMQDLNPHILCVLCGGYLVDATTIIECLHSFCRSCIVKYLETSYHCPVCDVEVHKTKPLLHIRRDRTLQDIVYKIVPGIYCEELTRRKGFEAKLAEERPPEKEESVNDKDSDEKEIDSTPFEDSVCITLEYFRKTRNRLEKEVFPTRYLRCSSAVTVRVLTKFLVMKFAIPDTHKTEIIRCDEILDGHLTMKEVSRMYGLYVKPFVDLQYVFLEKNDTSVPSEKPRSLEPRRKRIKKRKGNKNLLKRCLVSSAPRPRKNTALENSSVPAPPLSCENSVETSQPRPCENERKEDLVLSPLHPCENVKKEDLIPSLPVASDKSQISKKLWNGDVGSRLPDEFQSVEKVGVIYPNTNAAEETTNENFISLVNSGAVENLNHETSGVPEPKTGSNNVFDDLLLSAPVGSTKDHDQQSSEPSDGSAVLSTNGSGNFTNELFINKTLSHLENLFA